MDCSPAGSSVHEISQARILEWVAIPFSSGSSWLRDQTHVAYISSLASTFFTPSAIWEARLGYNELTNSHETHTRISSHSSNIQTTFQNGRSPCSDPGIQAVVHPCHRSTGPPRSLASGRESESHPVLPSICLEVSTVTWMQAVESVAFWISMEEKVGLDSDAAEEPLLQQWGSLCFVPHLSKLTPVVVNSSDWWPGLLPMARGSKAPSLGDTGQ